MSYELTNQAGLRSVRTALGVSPFEKLRRLARQAIDPNNTAPWKIPSAWVALTTYKEGEVVSANGYWWVCQGPGTSAGSTGPNQPDIANVVVDGTIQWLLVGGPTATADDALAPTITRTTSAPSAPNNIPWGLPVSASADMVRFYSGFQNPGNTDRWRIATFNQSAASTLRSSGGRIGFWCDAATLTFLTAAINAGSEGPFRIIVDGRYLTPSAFTNANVNTYTTIAWGSRKSRFYEFEGWSRNGFFSTLITLYTSSADLIWKPSTENDMRVYWISDSQSAGHGFAPYQPGAGLPFRVGRYLGWNDVWNASIGGTGWTNAGAGPYYKYRERITEGLTRNPDLWVFFGSTNDQGATAGTITAEVVGAISDIRAGGSNVPIIFVGVEPIAAASLVAEAEIAAGVTLANDPYTFFVPIANAAPYPIMVGNFNRPASFNAGVNTFARDVNTTDSVHLMESAQNKHARFIADAIKTKVLVAV